MLFIFIIVLRLLQTKFDGFFLRIAYELWIIYFSVHDKCRGRHPLSRFVSVLGDDSGLRTVRFLVHRKFGVSNLKFHIVFHLTVLGEPHPVRKYLCAGWRIAFYIFLCEKLRWLAHTLTGKAIAQKKNNEKVPRTGEFLQTNRSAEIKIRLRCGMIYDVIAIVRIGFSIKFFFYKKKKWKQKLQYFMYTIKHNKIIHFWTFYTPTTNKTVRSVGNCLDVNKHHMFYLA